MNQRQTQTAPPEDEQDLAERGTAAGRQAVEHISHRGHRLDETFFRSKNQWRADEAGAAGAIFNTVTEKSDRAPVIDVAGVSVEGCVKFRTGGQQTDYPDAQRAKQRQPAESWFRFLVGAGRRHGAGRKLRLVRRQGRLG